MCKEDCENDFKNDINLISVEEREDGSMIVTMDLSEEMKNLLIEKGFNAILKEYIENS